MVRRATLGDTDELARLRWTMTDEMAGTARSPGEYWPAADGRSSSQNGTSASSGWSGVQLVERVPRPVEAAATYAYITSVYVEAEHRNAGLGRRILDAAVAWIRAEHIDTVVLWPSERSVPFYERAGFTPSDSLGLGR